MLPGEGETRTLVQTRRRQTCEFCGEPATRRISYLLDNARFNPASAAYRHDDCTWCSDGEAWACEDHKKRVEGDAPEGMSWCSTFDGLKYPHMLLYWETEQ
jgi:hypothetical protein